MSFIRRDDIIDSQTNNDKPAIATLPTKYGIESPNFNPESYNNSGLKFGDYSEKSFIVFGELTRQYKEQLKALGGKYNGHLKEKQGFPGGPGWIFFNRKAEVIDLINKINVGTITTHANQIGQINQLNNNNNNNNQAILPQVILPQKNKRYQTVSWKVFIPEKDMAVTINVGNVKMVGTIIQVNSTGKYIDTCYIDIDNNISKLVICNGKWQVWGYMIDHTVYFKNQPEINDIEETNQQDIINI